MRKYFKSVLTEYFDLDFKRDLAMLVLQGHRIFAGISELGSVDCENCNVVIRFFRDPHGVR